MTSIEKGPDHPHHAHHRHHAGGLVGQGSYTGTEYAYACRMVHAVRRAVDAAGSSPCRALISSIATQHGVRSDDLTVRVLEVLAAAHVARRRLAEDSIDGAGREAR